MMRSRSEPAVISKPPSLPMAMTALRPPGTWPLRRTASSATAWCRRPSSRPASCEKARPVSAAPAVSDSTRTPMRKACSLPMMRARSATSSVCTPSGMAAAMSCAISTSVGSEVKKPGSRTASSTCGLRLSCSARRGALPRMVASRSSNLGLAFNSEKSCTPAGSLLRKRSKARKARSASPIAARAESSLGISSVSSSRALALRVAA